jgi:hypothetical protein
MTAARALGLAITATALLCAIPGGSARADEPCRVLTGARVHLPGGPSDDAVIVLVGERIAAAGNIVAGLELSIPNTGSARFQGQACVQQDYSGREITAGLIEAGSSLGLVEIGLEAATRDHNWEAGPANRAALVVADAYNARSTLIPVARLGGITSALIVPRGGLISGQGAVVDLRGGSQQEAVVNRSAALYASMRTGGSRAAGIHLLGQALDDARFLSRNGAAYEAGRTRPLSAGPLALAAIADVVRNRIPLVVAADRAADIEALLRLAATQNIRLVIAGGAEAWLLADELSTARVAVIVNPLVYGPGSFDQVEARADNAALLDAAGVHVIIATGSSHFARNLRQRAGNAVRGGLSHHAALRAITATPAEVFGLRHRGRIEAGAIANLVSWSGDPLEISSRPLEILIRGAAMPLRSRQTELLDRYRRPPGTPVPPEPLPTP